MQKVNFSLFHQNLLSKLKVTNRKIQNIVEIFHSFQYSSWTQGSHGSHYWKLRKIEIWILNCFMNFYQIKQSCTSFILATHNQTVTDQFLFPIFRFKHFLQNLVWRKLHESVLGPSICHSMCLSVYQYVCMTCWQTNQPTDWWSELTDWVTE